MCLAGFCARRAAHSGALFGQIMAQKLRPSEVLCLRMVQIWYIRSYCMVVIEMEQCTCKCMSSFCIQMVHLPYLQAEPTEEEPTTQLSLSAGNSVARCSMCVSMPLSWEKLALLSVRTDLSSCCGPGRPLILSHREGGSRTVSAAAKGEACCADGVFCTGKASWR